MSTQQREMLYSDFQDMLVLSYTALLRYCILYTDDSTIPEIIEIIVVHNFKNQNFMFITCFRIKNLQTYHTLMD
jgi:hypothetical protein